MIPMTCDKCKQTMAPLVSANKPEASEWYCFEDHLSKRMSDKDAIGIIQARNQARADMARQEKR